MRVKYSLRRTLWAILVLVFITGCATMQSRWETAKLADTIQAYEEFLREYPKGNLANQAHARLKELYEQRYWKDAKAKDTISAYEDFIRNYPRGKFENDARSRLAVLYWQKAKESNTITTYEDFLKHYPKSKFLEEARTKIEELYFKQAQAKDTISAYDEFLRRYPQGMFANEARSRREKLYMVMVKDWENAQSVNTISAYKAFLERYPAGDFSNKARSYLTERRVEGWVQKIDRSSNTITLKTAMGNKEVLAIDQETQVKKKDRSLSMKDLKEGESVSIEYLSLPRNLLSRKVSLGYSVSYCSCGSSCTCPLSRGCRVIKY